MPAEDNLLQFEDAIKESIIEVTNESAIHLDAMNENEQNQSSYNKSLSLDLIYQGATGAANIEFEDLDIGIKLPEDQQHNPKSPSRDDLVIIAAIPMNGFPKITPILESNNNPYAD